MLTKATMEDVANYCDFAYRLALNPAKSCYPTYADGIKTKEEFVENSKKGVTEEEWELLLFSREGIVEGWIQYFWIPEEQYLQLYSCNINRGTEQALAELLALLRERFDGYTLYFGFPGDNTDAVGFLRVNGFECVEEAWNNSFFFERYVLRPEEESVVRISRENYGDFRVIHEQAEEDIYWNCDRILEQFDRWTIFVYYREGRPVGTVFLWNESFEIFGLEFTDDGYRAEACRALLVAALNHCKRRGAKYMTFFCEDRNQKTVSDLGFQCVGKYVCYIKRI